jgi:hypothetical protein
MCVPGHIRFIKLAFFLLIIIMHWESNSLCAQIHCNKATVNFTNQKLSEILDSLSRKFGVNFSYNADLEVIKKEKSISCYAGLDEILKVLFKSEGIDFTIVADQVIIFSILSPLPEGSIQQKANNNLTIKGAIADSSTHLALPFATIAVVGRNIWTVANIRGEFSIKVPSVPGYDSLMFSNIGYKPGYWRIDSGMNNNLEIMLSETIINIKQVVVNPISGLNIVKEVIKNARYNYRDKNTMYSGFYRETNREEKQYFSICEAVLDIAKAPYNSAFFNDQARVFKGRKFENMGKNRELNYKLEGGIYNCLRLDLIKDRAAFLETETLDWFEYAVSTTVQNNNRSLYVIAFDQKEDVALPLYKGLLYVDVETKALVAAKFSLSPRGIKYARNLLVKREPRAIKVKPEGADYQVYYRNINGKWHLGYVRAEIRIKAKGTKLIFNSLFTSVSELAITDIDTANYNRFRWNEIVRSQDIVVDQLTGFDPFFWNKYNIIQPEQSMLEEIKNLGMKKGLVEENSFWDILF